MKLFTASFSSCVALAIALVLPPAHFATQAAPAMASTRLNRYEVAQRQTVLIQHATGQGSGVVIERTNAKGEKRIFVLTAAHVVAGGQDIKVVQIARRPGEAPNSRKDFEAVIVAISVEEDLALLWVKGAVGVFTPVSFNFDLLRVGDPLFHVGNYYGQTLVGSVATGIVAQIGVHPEGRTDWPWPLVDQSDTLIISGSSGGGMFSADGRVVGIVVGGIIGTGVSFYVPSRQVLKWARSAGAEWSLVGKWCPDDASFLAHAAAVR